LNYSGNYSYDNISAWTNPNKVNDGNWTSFGYVKVNMSDNIFINYVKPPTALSSSLWQYNQTKTPLVVNYTIHSSCWLHNPNILSFKINSTAGNTYSRLYCLNDTDWYNITDFNFYSVAEEGMWWEVNDSITTFTQNVNNISIFINQSVGIQINATNSNNMPLTWNINNNILSITQTGYINDSSHTPASIGNWSITVNASDGVYYVVNMTFNYEVIGSTTTFTQDISEISIFTTQKVGIQINATNSNNMPLTWNINNNILSITQTGYINDSSHTPADIGNWSITINASGGFYVANMTFNYEIMSVRTVCTNTMYSLIDAFGGVGTLIVIAIPIIILSMAFALFKGVDITQYWQYIFIIIFSLMLSAVVIVVFNGMIATTSTCGAIG
jgi:hypothetical protein